MAYNLPVTDLGKVALAKINAALPKFEHEGNPLAEIVRSKEYLLYQITINPDILAMELRGMNVLTGYDVDKIKSLCTNFEKTQNIYDIIFMRGHVAPQLIRALERTGNNRVIYELLAMASQSAVLNEEVIDIGTGAGKHSGSRAYFLITLREKVAEKIQRLKNDGAYLPEMEFFRPHLGKFLIGTINPDDVALRLFAMGVISMMQLDKVRSKLLDYDKNDIIYDFISRVGFDEGVVPLLNALQKTGNDRMLKFIDEIASI